LLTQAVIVKAARATLIRIAQRPDDGQREKGKNAI
jgi:hypothetical protein